MVVRHSVLVCSAHITLIKTEHGRFWYMDNFTHCPDDYPAVEWNHGTREWWMYGNLHRDGELPAVIYASGMRQYWMHGVKFAGLGITD